jgi:hypothetical protein
MLGPKSIIHISRGRRVTSMPLTHGRTTSEFGLLLGLPTSASISRARSPEMSNGPPLMSAMNATCRFLARGLACVRSSVPVRSAFICSTGVPSSILSTSVPLSKPTIETLTAAPLSIQERSDSAKKMSPVSFMRRSTRRFAPPRIELVASSPTRRTFPSSISRRALSNQ